jgi:fructuronate reductase
VSPPLLTRAGGRGRPEAPVRLVHLGLGSFFRAHQAWYTDQTSAAQEWGIAGFTGRDSGDLADRLNAQEGLYTLISRAATGEEYGVVSALSRAHPARDHSAWLSYFGSRDVAAVTITITEAGYLRRPDGRLDLGHPKIQADLAAMRSDVAAVVRTAPARLVAGLAARHRAGEGPLAVVPCDNEPGNGPMTARVIREFAEQVSPELAAQVTSTMSVVTTMVDRITPRTTQADLSSVIAATGVTDRCPVATEPFHEWVLSGDFPAGRPTWEAVGAIFTDDITTYEQRKLWLLNGGHSLLAYTGSVRGHRTVADAVADDTCHGWLEQWWAEASRHLDQPERDLATYRSALLDRFANPRMHHRLEQIATDGSQKLPIRILSVLRRERAAARIPSGATRVLAAWICQLRGIGTARIADARADTIVPLATGALTDAVPRVLDALDPALGADSDVVTTVIDQYGELAGSHNGRS